MRIALIQHATHDKRENLQRGVDAVRRAAASGAGCACFAELSFEWFHPQSPATGNIKALAESVPGPTTRAIQNVARECGIVVVCDFFERDGDRMYDCSPVIDADGTLLGRTRMIHITDYPCFHEKGYYALGDTGVPIYDTAMGRVGVAICYDRHYPEYLRALGTDGAEIVVVPKAGAVDEWPEGLQEAEMRVTAFQNGYYVALCNRVGRENRLTFAGESFVSAPTGTVVARGAKQQDQVLYVDLNLSAVPASHARRLFLPDRRPELYSAWISPHPHR